MKKGMGNTDGRSERGDNYARSKVPWRIFSLIGNAFSLTPSLDVHTLVGLLFSNIIVIATFVFCIVAETQISSLA